MTQGDISQKKMSFLRHMSLIARLRFKGAQDEATKLTKDPKQLESSLSTPNKTKSAIRFYASLFHCPAQPLRAALRIWAARARGFPVPFSYRDVCYHPFCGRPFWFLFAV